MDASTQTTSQPPVRATSRGRLGRRGGATGSGISDVRGPRGVERRDAMFRRALLVADSLAALAAILLAVQVIGDDTLHPLGYLAAPLVVLVSKVIGLYDHDELVLRKSTLDEAPKLFQLAALYALMLSLLQSHLIEGRLSAVQVLGIWGLLFVMVLAGRYAARALAGSLAPPERCVIIGDIGYSTIGEKLDRGGDGHLVLAGRVRLDFDAEQSLVIDRIREAIMLHDAHRVILAPQSTDSANVLDAIRLAKSLGVKVSLLPRLFEVIGTSVVFDDIDGVTVLGVRRFGLTRSSALVKRATDLVISGLGIVAISPLLAMLVIAIRLDSRGPLLYRQIRVGRDGNRFEMLKFRSMNPDADAAKEKLREEHGLEAMFKLDDDPRVTRVGQFLRASSLDELPQLFNVFRGDMSLVGPRPLILDEDRLVEGWHRRRLHLVPGMTGPWQVLGSTRVPLQEMVKIDYVYIANWSLWRDVKILIRTAAHVLKRSGV